MEGLVVKGARVWLTKNAPGKKLKYTWQMIELDGVKIGANTSLPNPIVQSMLRAQCREGAAPSDVTPWFSRAKSARFEVAYGSHSRVDAVLHEDDGAMNMLEIKNVHLVYPDGGAYFPDSVSERATKHMRELTALEKEGERATVLFLIQREDAKFLRPSDVHDPEFAAAARAAGAAGVRILAVVFRATNEGLVFEREVPVDLAPYDTTQAKAWMEALRSTTGWERPKRADSDASDEEEPAPRAKKSAKKSTKKSTKKSPTKKATKTTKKPAAKPVKKPAAKKAAKPAAKKSAPKATKKR
jgi:sugar fermentation stimulation protein A